MSQVDLKEKLYIKTKGVIKTSLYFFLQSVYENLGQICYVEPKTFKRLFSRGLQFSKLILLKFKKKCCSLNINVTIFFPF